MRPLAHLVTPWLFVAGLVGYPSPTAAQVAVQGGIEVTVGAPGPIAQPYPAPRRGYPVPYPGPRGRVSPGLSSWAFDAGYEDGYREGLRDGRRGGRYDPFAQRDFRRATRGYQRQHGPKSFYQDRYRLGFRRGYERGYRHGAYADQWRWPRGRHD